MRINLTVASLSILTMDLLPVLLDGKAFSASNSSAPDFEVPMPSNHEAMEPDVVRDMRDRIAAVRANPESAEAVGQLGLFYQGNLITEHALPCYRRAIELAPDEPQWRYLAAVVCTELSDLDAAEILWRDLHRMTPDRPEPLYHLGELLLSAGCDDEAVSCFRDLVSVAPDTAAGYLGLGIVHQRRGEFASARVWLEKARLRSPESKRILHPLGMVTQRLALAQDDPQLAETARTLLLAARGQDTVPLIDDRWAWLIERAAVMSSLKARQADALIAQGRFDDAARIYEDVIRRHPNHWAFLLQLAHLRFAQGRHTECRDLCDRAVQASPNNQETWAALADICRELGDFDAARDAAKQALLCRPGTAGLHFLLGRIDLESNRASDAVPSFRAVLGIEPDHSGAAVRLADALIRLERADEALPAARLAVELQPGSAYARFELAVALDQTGDVDGAIRELNQVIVLSPESVSARRYLESIRDRESRGARNNS